MDVDDGRRFQIGGKSAEQLLDTESEATRGKAAWSKHRVAAGGVGDRIGRPGDVLVNRFDLRQIFDQEIGSPGPSCWRSSTGGAR